MHLHFVLNNLVYLLLQGSDNKFCGQVSTIMRVITNEDGVLLSQFDNFNEKDIPVLERLADLPTLI